MSSPHFAMRLNNFLQGRYGASFAAHFKYEDTSSGPQNLTVWTGTYFINDMKYGDGSATTRRVAKEAAAQKTIEMLEAEGNDVPP
ncbi:uncharacterized protein BJ212DRAFT_1482609 [Suillus subaureus]|uniref:DRBM domain-containing protein n=1 Tax=Suillus subaureus TaxID=48587 RepID=A0A9P7E731_9AGAM|nr:uncharacterized protein BJ212DRAFT_1482609 [Suillus subaureus]KAG1813137.1 hypothetical protein BJ212DRAFT_1482609 [Suillus subaureus]